jgi:hypothetical protein
MSLKIRFRFDGKCMSHPRYDPLRDGQPQHGHCVGCESLYVVQLYLRIATKGPQKGRAWWFDRAR